MISAQPDPQVALYGTFDQIAKSTGAWLTGVNYVILDFQARTNRTNTLHESLPKEIMPDWDQVYNLL